MTAPRRPLVAANWKMNGLLAINEQWTSAFVAQAPTLPCDVVVCPPYVYLCTLVRVIAPAELGAQDLSPHSAGAYTGDVSGEMLADLGCRWVIVGHSERRQFHAETDAIVAAKAARAVQSGLRPIVCVGETLAEREAGRTHDVVRTQLAAVIDRIGGEALARGALAYEPVWAIGTGRNATPQQAQDVHAALRVQVIQHDRAAGDALRILYGGSVKPANAADLFSQPDIDGGLIGGASLSASDFLAICTAARI